MEYVEGQTLDAFCRADDLLPVDTTVMGAGTGPTGGNTFYTQNRATIHLHGGDLPPFLLSFLTNALPFV